MNKILLYMLSVLVGVIGCGLIFQDALQAFGASLIYCQIIYWLSEIAND